MEMNLKCTIPGLARTMPIYRTYVLDQRGHVVVAIDLECAEAGLRIRLLPDRS